MELPNPSLNKTKTIDLFLWEKPRLKNRDKLCQFIVDKSQELNGLEIIQNKMPEHITEQTEDLLTLTPDKILRWTKNILYKEDENLSKFISAEAVRCVTIELITKEPIKSQLN